MSDQANTMSDVNAEPQTPAPAVLARTRPFYWSVRRELWENRAIYVAPMIAAGVVLLGVLLGAINPPHMTRAVQVGGIVHHQPIVLPPIVHYAIAGAVILLTGLVVAVFYCLGSLHNERRDRSILFWKSLPVSDLTTVLSKAMLPLVVLPIATFAVIVATHLVMLAIGVGVALANGQDVSALWDQVQLFKVWGLILYSLVVLALWHAPLWGWFMMVSAWAKRTTFLWGVGPPLALCVVERFAFGASHIWSLITYRIFGGLKEAFVSTPQGQQQGLEMPQIDVAKFVATPGLWIGLVAAALFLAAAVWLRRRREPI